MILVSVFRDAASYVDRYIEQVKSLRELRDVTVVCAEGDSEDITYDLLRATDFHVLKVEHGGPKYPSVEHPMRWRQLAVVCNVALTAAVRLMDDDEPVVYCESDLIWDADTLDELCIRATRYPAVAPLSLRVGTDLFYDIWGHRKDGQRFSKYPPYHPGVPHDRMVTIDSAGSCIALSSTVARVVEFSQTDCILGIGQSLRKHGYQLWLDPSLKVEHP